MKTQTIKSGSVVFLIHALSVVNILLCKNDLITDVAWFEFQIILCIIMDFVKVLLKRIVLRRS